MTSKGQDTKPAIAAAMAPLIEALYTEVSPNTFFVLKYSNKGNCIAEKSMSLANVGFNPIYKPDIPFYLTI